VFVTNEPTTTHKLTLAAPLKALRHKGLLMLSLVALLYNWAFFTVLAYAPLQMGISNAVLLGLIFFGWGILVAIFAVFVAPRLERRFGLVPVLVATFTFLTLDLAVAAIWADIPAVLIAAVIVSGVASGLNNTLVTQAVMEVAPVERPVASAAYSFVRFFGGGLAPFVAGIVGTALSVHVPFWIAVAALVIAIALLLVSRTMITDGVAAAEASEEEVLPVAAGDSPAEPVMLLHDELTDDGVARTR
jgi:MFS family permease